MTAGTNPTSGKDSEPPKELGSVYLDRPLPDDPC
jgi:hypothetical protein